MAYKSEISISKILIINFYQIKPHLILNAIKTLTVRDFECRDLRDYGAGSSTEGKPEQLMDLAIASRACDPFKWLTCGVSPSKS